MGDSINLLLIPYSKNSTVALPKNLVEYVLPYAPPLPSAYENEALIGSLIYKNDKVPIVDLARLENPDVPARLPELAEGQYRLIILSCIMQSSFCNNYAIIANGAPRLFEVKADTLTDLDVEVPALFYSKVKLGSKNSTQQAFIPDLEKLESALFSTN